MVVHGFQKMTLLDYPGKVACTVFTGGCNLRCPFCHNALLVTKIDSGSAFDSDEIISFLNRRKGLLDGVCVTGGEPTLQKDLPQFLAEVKELGFLTKLDTNGTAPEKLREIVENGLVDYVAMDIKNSREKYAETVGVKNFDITPVEKSVEYLLSDKVDYEFRTTVVAEFHTVQSITEAAKWIKGAPRYFLQAFTDSGNLIGSGLSGVGKEEMTKMRDAAAVFVPNTSVRGI